MLSNLYNNGEYGDSEYREEPRIRAIIPGDRVLAKVHGEWVPGFMGPLYEKGKAAVYLDENPRHAKTIALSSIKHEDPAQLDLLGNDFVVQNWVHSTSFLAAAESIEYKPYNARFETVHIPDGDDGGFPPVLVKMTVARTVGVYFVPVIAHLKSDHTYVLQAWKLVTGEYTNHTTHLQPTPVHKFSTDILGYAPWTPECDDHQLVVGAETIGMDEFLVDCMKKLANCTLCTKRPRGNEVTVGKKTQKIDEQSEQFFDGASVELDPPKQTELVEAPVQLGSLVKQPQGQRASIADLTPLANSPHFPWLVLLRLQGLL